MPTSLVLGAGASLANALHFRIRRLPQSRPPLDATFFRTVRARRVTLSVYLRRYFIDVLGVDPTSDELDELRMEEVFKDVFFDFQDNPRDTRALNAYIDLVDLYLRVLGETTNWLNADNRTGGPIGRLVADAAGHTNELAVITFNHDLVIENEIQRRANLRSRWCIDAGYGTIGNSMTPLLPRGGAAAFRRHDATCDHTRSIRVLKLHGSLNWMRRIGGRRPTASFLSGSSNPGNTQLIVRRQILQDTRYFRRAGGRGRTSWHMWPLVVPPVYAKQALRAALHAAWDDARAPVEAADRLVFFGYSLPLIDIEAEKLFQRALALNTALQWIDVINPDPRVSARYATVSREVPVRWYPTLERFLAAGGCRSEGAE